MTALKDINVVEHALTNNELNFIDDKLVAKHWKAKSYRISLTFPIAGLVQPYLNLLGGIYHLPDVWISGLQLLIAYLWMKNREDGLKRTFAFFWGMLMIALPFIDPMYLFAHKIMLWVFGVMFLSIWLKRAGEKKMVLTPELLDKLEEFRSEKVANP